MTEKMIPASKIVEVARKYAEEHGLCDVVDKALREIGALEDCTVTVTLTFKNVPPGFDKELIKDGFGVWSNKHDTDYYPDSMSVESDYVGASLDDSNWFKAPGRKAHTTRHGVAGDYSLCGSEYVGHRSTSQAVTESEKCKNCLKALDRA